MSEIQFRKAERKRVKLRMGICGPAGSGKTYSALLVAKGLGGRVAIVDTEKSSSELYSHVMDYDVLILDPPFTAEKYLAAIHAAEEAGYDVLILDSISHIWAGEGGLLDQQSTAASKSGNRYTAWNAVTPLHYRFIDAMLQCKCHLIATMRSKVEYVQDKDGDGKTVIRKVGMAPVQREGMDYEFSLVFDVDQDHMAIASKDRTSQYTGRRIRLSEEVGRDLAKWLEAGVVEPTAPPKPVPVPAKSEPLPTKLPANPAPPAVASTPSPHYETATTAPAPVTAPPTPVSAPPKPSPAAAGSPYVPSGEVCSICKKDISEAELKMSKLFLSAPHCTNCMNHKTGKTTPAAGDKT